ncbi:hypothetical protein IFM89_002028, partial [Coptis chinensis]
VLSVVSGAECAVCRVCAGGGSVVSVYLCGVTGSQWTGGVYGVTGNRRRVMVVQCVFNFATTDPDFLQVLGRDWEVHHGSMMALREIITHHGGSSGVFTPDLSSESAHSDKTEVKQELTTLKRKMELDMSVQVPGEEIEPNWKKLKSEDGICSTIYTITSMDEGANLGTCIKMEDGGCDLILEQVSDVLKVESDKVEAEAYVYDVGSHSKEGGDMVVARGKTHRHAALSATLRVDQNGRFAMGAFWVSSIWSQYDSVVVEEGAHQKPTVKTIQCPPIARITLMDTDVEDVEKLPTAADESESSVKKLMDSFNPSLKMDKMVTLFILRRTNAFFVKSLTTKGGYSETVGNKFQILGSSMSVILVLYELHLFIDALVSFNRSCELQLENFKPHFHARNCLYILGKWGEGKEEFLLALEAAQRGGNHSSYLLPQIHVNLGISLEGEGRAVSGVGEYNAAEKALAKAIFLKSAYADARFDLGSTLHAIEEDERAIQELQKAIDLKPEHIDTLYNLGGLYMNMGRFQRASEMYTRVLAILPNHWRA